MKILERRDWEGVWELIGGTQENLVGAIFFLILIFSPLPGVCKMKHKTGEK